MQATLATPAAGAGAAATAPTRPNLVFIVTDDQRYDALGCAGNPHIHTPNLDRLAARGVLFKNAFVTLSICSPSRAACLTGRYGSVNGVTTLDRPLAAGEVALAQRLRRVGYRTGHTGKWHLKTSAADCGFDESHYFISNGAYYGRAVHEEGKRRRVPGFIDDWVADRSIRFMQGAVAAGQPFFLWVCTQVPHMDHTHDWPAREETLALYDQSSLPLPATWNDDLSGKPGYLKEARSRTQALKYRYDTPEGLRRHHQRYYAAVTEVDASLGRVIDEVNRLGIRDNTWFVLMGDNGWFLGEHGFTSKVLAYEESMRVPMIVVGPRTPPRVDSHLVLNIDLAATLAELAGLPVPTEMHGRSLLPLIQGEENDWRTDFFYEAPTPTLGSWPLYAVRTERWKYIQTRDLHRRDQVFFEELYDLDADPTETRNVVAAAPKEREALAQRLDASRDALSRER